MTISPKFTIGQTVYLRVNPDNAGMVTGYEIRAANVITYWVGFGGSDHEEALCWDIELTSEKSFSTE